MIFNLLMFPSVDKISFFIIDGSTKTFITQLHGRYKLLFPWLQNVSFDVIPTFTGWGECHKLAGWDGKTEGLERI